MSLLPISERESSEITVWQGSGDVQRSSVLLVDKEDVEPLLDFIRKGDVTLPTAIYYVVPEASPFKETLAYFLRYVIYQSHSTTSSDPEVRRFFTEWERLCARPARFQGMSLAQYLEDAPQQVHQAVPTLDVVAEVISLIFQRVLGSELCIQSVFGDSGPAEEFVRWWRTPPKRIREFENLLTRAQRMWSGNEYWEMLRERVGPVFEVLKALTSRDLHNSMDAAAVYCFAAGEVSRECGQNISALSLFHRALDFFLQARCVEHRLVRETVSGLMFEIDSREDRLSVLSCYSALRKSGAVLRNDKLAQQIVACNRIRNRLITTHAVYGSGDSHVLRYREAVVGIMREIDSSAVRGIERIGNVNPMGKSLNPAVLFACETDLRHCIASVALT